MEFPLLLLLCSVGKFCEIQINNIKKLNRFSKVNEIIRLGGVKKKLSHYGEILTECVDAEKMFCGTLK